MKKNRCVVTLAVLFAMLTSAVIVRAQATASISGRVVDNTGATIPDAKVTVKNLETGELRTTTTEQSGIYHVPSVPVGKYLVQVEKDGFKTGIRSGIDLVVGQEAAIDVGLEVGSLSQQVTVSADVPVVNTTTAQTSGLVGEQAVKDLPLNGRSFDNLITLNAGTVNYTSMHTTSSQYSGGLGNLFSVGGRRVTENIFLYNGVEYGGVGNTANSPGSASGELLGIDAVREFNVLTDNYPAEYGRRDGAQISVVTMSGTNVLHGTVFDFLRNSDLDARNFFDASPSLLGGRIPHFERNNFGGSLGGAIKKDKTFLFGNYEGLRQMLGLSNVADVPDLNARNGLLQIVPGGPLVNVGVAPGVAPYLALFPLPNGPNVGGGVAEYFNSAVQTVREDFGSARFDQIFSSKDSFYAVYTVDDGVALTPEVTNTFTTNVPVRSQLASFSEVHIFSPNIINTLTFGFDRAQFDQTVQATINIPANLDFIQGNALGAISIGAPAGSGGGALSSLGAGNVVSDTRNIFTETDNLQITRGKHLLSFGVWFFRLQENSQMGENQKATFSDLQALMQGQLQLFQAVPYPSPMSFRSLEGAWFAEDAIKIRPNFTLSAGLRHEFTDGWNEANGKMTEYVPGPNGVLLTQPVIGTSAFTQNNALFLFEPRVGIAWDPFSNGKMAVHAGFGIYHNLLDNMAYQSSLNQPYNLQIQISNSTFPFPQLTPANYTAIPGALPGPVSLPQNMDTPTVIAYNLDVEKGLGANLALTVSYAGSHGYHLATQTDVNSVYPIVCGAAVQPYPVPAGATCPGLPTGTLYYGYKGAARRNPLLASSKMIASDADSNYNALKVDLTQRTKYGLFFKANYTFSKSLDDASSQAPYQNSASSPLNPENLLFDYGPSAFNVTQRFSFSGSYELPFGKGKAFWSTAHGVADAIAGGWQVTTIVTIQTGLALNPQLGFAQSGNGNSNAPDRPSLNPNFSGPLYLNTPSQWFNPNAFILPVAGTYGNAERDSLLTPGLKDADLSLLKNFAVSERMRLQFRAEAFNFLNLVNFGLPNNVILNTNGTVRSTAGQITATATTSRQLQFGLKLIW